MQVEKLEPGQIDQLLATNGYVQGPLRAKMVPTDQGEFLKFFYDESGLHWSTLKPKARRFAENSARLNHLGFSAPIIDRLAHCPDEGVWLVTYRRLPGEDLRALDDVKHLEAMPAFMARLHEKGVYFRGIHLGNVLCRDNGQYSLVDISGMKIWPMPLTLWQRLRNLGRFVSFPEDAALFQAFGVSRFCTQYCRAAKLDGWRSALLTRAVMARVQAQ